MEREEIITRLNEINKMGFVKSTGSSNSAAGRTLEGIMELCPNCSATPDFGKIELKSIVSPKDIIINKPVGLFSQVPDWSNSQYGNINEFFNDYHYYTNHKRQLFVSVNSQRSNNMGLRLYLNNTQLFEIGEVSGKHLLSWDIEVLWQKLLFKHNQTFWVFA
jgi:hypothetical protein